MPEYHLRFDRGRFLSHLCNVTDHLILAALFKTRWNYAKHEGIGRSRGIGTLIFTLKLLVSVQLHATVALIRRRELPIGLHVRYRVGSGSCENFSCLLGRQTVSLVIIPTVSKQTNKYIRRRIPVMFSYQRESFESQCWWRLHINAGCYIL